jgi:hypothetical protein
MAKSLQAQIDILQVEVQSLGEEMETQQAAAVAASKWFMFMCARSRMRAELSPAHPPGFETTETTEGPPHTDSAAANRRAPSPPRHTQTPDSPDRARVLSHMGTRSPAKAAPAPSTVGFSPGKADAKANEKTVKFSPSKHLMTTQSAFPVRNFLAKKIEAEQSRQSPEAAMTPTKASSAARGSDVHSGDPMSDVENDDDAHSEGSDVFPVTGSNTSSAVKTPQHTRTERSANEGVTAFSPGSPASPPQRPKLSISTTAPILAPAAALKPPATPDSPWDEESELEESTPASKASRGADPAGTAAVPASEADTGDSSSVDTDLRDSSRLARSASTEASSTAPIPGPSVSQVSSLYQGGARSPVKLSGSLLRGGRSSGPAFGGANKF